MFRHLGAFLALLGLCAAARAEPLSPAEALACAAARYRGEALVLRDEGDVTELRWLTPAGNVLRISLAGPGCRFVEVEGVGQTEARILPVERP
ncbi:MAG: Cys/Met metabolism pyridoxal-phosphate-dependent enzyme [Gemmobacter sp.]